MKSPIVILHGWGLSSKRFQPLVDSLKSKGFSSWAPDLPGFGSAKPPDSAWSVDMYADHADKFLKDKKICKPILIGHSFGGRVALKYAKRYPNNLRALILTGTPGFTPVAKKKLAVFILLAKLGGFLFSIPPFNLVKSTVQRWYYYVVGARDFYRAEGVMRDIFKKVVKEELVTAMESVKVPTLLIWGQDDIITPVWIAQKMQTIIQNSQLIIVPEADHGISYKQPQRFAEEILPFLTSV